MDLKTLDATFVAPTYRRFPIEIVRGSGSIVYDEKGKSYIDLTSGIGVTSFGVADETWQKAVTQQISLVQHMSNLYYTEPCAHLAALLCEKTGMKKVFFSNSGAEANECAIKVARKYAFDNHGEDCFTIATLNGSFHGRTLTTLAATGQAHYHELFQPLTPGFIHIDPTMEALREAAKTHKIAALIVECIQGEGGVVNLPQEFLKEARAFTKEHDILLICDEVQTGNGRTGQLYAYMNYGIEPDIVSTAKGLAGGLPLGATLLSEKVQNTLGFGDHGSTFGGNPVCCAAALSILQRIDEQLLAQVREKSELLREAFQNAKGIQSVSGMGLMLGLATDRPAGEIVSALIERGVLCLTAKDKVRLLPALNIPNDTLLTAAEIIKEVCAEK
ncbi:MAG: acetylornithine/succinylornithine family transaminase [Clostridia bacterium]|nr:acetylornithine/succinylornithine family transaminase [Clostridia bacterium]